MRLGPSGPARFLRTHHIAAVLVALLTVTFGATGFVWAHKGVTVVVDGEALYMKTQARDVSALLAQAEIDVDAGDVVSPSATTQLADGMTVVVRHSVPVTLSLGEETLELDVIGTTVADALVAAGVDPGAGLVVEPGIDAPLTAGMTIAATDVFVRIVQEEQPVPFAVVTRDDPAMAAGTRRVVTPGREGKKLLIYRVLVTDGVEGARVLTAERVVSGPVDEVVAVGTKRASHQVARAKTVVAAAPREGIGSKLAVTATAYAPGADGVGTRTATGARAGFGIVAVDPRVIPLGTRLYIPGYGYGIAADTGGAVRGNRIDLCFDSAAQALEWGRRSVTIVILP
jgi:uncharacterized protein YabE (DUF348 family)